jgi:hypothetical protein
MPNYRKSEGFASHRGFGVFGPFVAPHLNGTANSNQKVSDFEFQPECNLEKIY